VGISTAGCGATMTPHSHQAIRCMSLTARLAALALALVGCATEPAIPIEDEPVKGGVVETDLGTITSDAPFKITIPQNAIGFHLVVEVDASVGTEQIGIAQVIAPSGELVVDDFYSPGNKVPFATEFGIVAISIPQTSATAKEPVEPGEWTVIASTVGNLPTRAKLFVRTTEDGQFHGGALDLRLYIPDGLVVPSRSAHAITAGTAASDPAIAAQLDGFYTTLKQVFDLDRGNVEFVALPSAYADMTDPAMRNEAMRMTSSSGTPAAHFILVNALATATGNTLWGTTTWNPGTAMVTGHPMTGVFLNVSLSKSPAADGGVMVHELGHFLGLYHTTENDRRYHDPLDDTPECQPSESVCPDVNNIMFAGSRSGGPTASAQQRRVVWGSPLYRQTE
jgi:hypothetical protein